MTNNIEDIVQSFIKDYQNKSFINGEWVQANSNKTITAIDPGTGEAITSFPAMEKEEVNQAVHAAKQAFETKGWSDLTTTERNSTLNRLADMVEEHKAVITQLERITV